MRAKANLAEYQRDLERKKTLVERKFISAAERDKAQSVYDAGVASLKVVESQVKNGEALVRQREAQLAQARVDLERTAIKAPVDGVVVKRSIEPGQTVAASLQAPELFVIARNLTDMQVETSIDEADVGRIQTGQKASFTVDAFPGPEALADRLRRAGFSEVRWRHLTFGVVAVHVGCREPEAGPATMATRPRRP